EGTSGTNPGRLLRTLSEGSWLSRHARAVDGALPELHLRQLDHARSRDGEEQSLHSRYDYQWAAGGAFAATAGRRTHSRIPLRQSENDWSSGQGSRKRATRLPAAAGRDRNPGTPGLSLGPTASQDQRKHSLRRILVRKWLGY